MTLLEPRTASVIVTTLLIAAALALVWATWHVLVTFLFAIFFAYLVSPVVQFLMRRLRLSRSLAITVVYLVIAAGLAMFFLFIGPDIARQATRLAQTAPQLYQKVATGQIAWQFGAEHGWSYDTKLRIQQFLAQHSGYISRLAQGFATRLAQLGSNAWWLVLIPILAIFFLKDGDQFSQEVVEIFARRRQREFVEAVMNDVNLMLASYVRVQIVLVMTAMAAYLTGLNLLHIPYATVLGVIGGILEFIPMAGPLISFLLILVVALGGGYGHVLVLAAFLGGWRVLQDYVISPRLTGSQLRLHPLAVLFGIPCGAEIGGVIGIYLSIPVMASVRIVWRRWQAYSHTENNNKCQVMGNKLQVTSNK